MKQATEETIQKRRDRILDLKSQQREFSAIRGLKEAPGWKSLKSQIEKKIAYQNKVTDRFLNAEFTDHNYSEARKSCHSEALLKSIIELVENTEQAEQMIADQISEINKEIKDITED